MSDMNMGYSPMTKAVYREAAVFTFLDSSFPFSMGGEREEIGEGGRKGEGWEERGLEGDERGLVTGGGLWRTMAIKPC